MATHVMIIPNPADPFSLNIAAWLPKVSELGNDLSITDQAEEADLILFVDSYTDTRYRFIRHHPLTARQPHKCFLYSQSDNPIHVLPGVYSNLFRRHHRPGWSDSFCYVDTYKSNPYLAKARELCSERLLLFSFLGRNSHPVRQKLFACRFDRADVIIEQTARYNHWALDERAEQFQRRYAEVSASSKFIVCPRGTGVSSIRLFEAMELGCVPVIVSDDWVPPSGPRWEDFSIRVPERNLHQLEAIIVERETDWEAMATLARQEWFHWFQEKNFLRQIVHRMLTLRASDRKLRRRCKASAWRRLQLRWVRQIAVDLKMRLLPPHWSFRKRSMVVWSYFRDGLRGRREP
jgi:Exostosin family